LSSPESPVFGFDWNHREIIITYVLTDTVFNSLIASSLFAMYMTVSWPRIAATQFTAYMAILNLSTVIGLKTSGYLYEAVPLPFLFMGAGVLQLVVICIFPFIDVHQARRELGHKKIAMLNSSV